MTGVTQREATARPVCRPAAPSILIIDDEPMICSFVVRALAADGYAVDCATNGADGLQRIARSEPDLVILDVVMPDMDGRTVLQRLLADHPDQAILVLSCLADVASKVEFLELGAQDYLTKPFSLAELLARIKVRLRDEARGHGETIRAGDLTLDIWRLEANCGHGPVPLTRLEFLLLRELMEHAGQSVPKEHLLASVWGIDFDPGSNVVDVCVRRLRSKLGFDLIRTVRGEGYQLAA